MFCLGFCLVWICFVGIRVSFCDSEIVTLLKCSFILTIFTFFWFLLLEFQLYSNSVNICKFHMNIKLVSKLLYGKGPTLKSHTLPFNFGIWFIIPWITLKYTDNLETYKNLFRFGDLPISSDENSSYPQPAPVVLLYVVKQLVACMCTYLSLHLDWQFFKTEIGLFIFGFSVVITEPRNNKCLVSLMSQWESRWHINKQE